MDKPSGPAVATVVPLDLDLANSALALRRCYLGAGSWLGVGVERFNVTDLCRVFGVSRSSFYDSLKQRDQLNPERDRLKSQAVLSENPDCGRTCPRICGGNALIGCVQGGLL